MTIKLSIAAPQYLKALLDGRGNGLRSKTHEPVLFERSEFTGECAELPNESSKLCTAARRCRGYRGNPPVLLFFCRRFLFQIKRKCRNAGSIHSLIRVRSEGRKWILQFYFVPLSRHRCVEVSAPYNVWERVPSIFASFVGR